MQEEGVPLMNIMNDKPKPRKDWDNPEDEKILKAARASDITELKRLFENELVDTWKIYEPTKDTLLHRIAYGAYSKSVEAATFILKRWDDSGINLQNKKRWTALHYACRSRQVQLVELLIDHGADTTITNDIGENPFQLVVKYSTPEAVKIAGILLKSNSQLIEGKTGKILVEDLLNNSSVDMLTFLWENFNSAISSFLLDAPSLWLAVRKGDGPNTVNCVKFLLDILPASAVNMEGNDGDGNTALHVAAKYCYVKVFETLVTNPNIEISQVNKKGETCLHLLTKASGKLKPLPCVKALFKSQQLQNDEVERKSLILLHNPKYQMEAPLQLAVKSRATKVARLLIQEHGGKSIANKTDLLADIYEKTPEAIIPLLDKCIYDSPNSEDDLAKITVDFGPITGLGGKNVRNESKLIHGIFKSPVEQQKIILAHPVGSIFLIEKWKKLQPLPYLYILSYVIWLLIYSFLCYELYPPHCPNATLTVSDQTGWPKLIRSFSFEKRLATESCNFNSVMAKLCALILLVYFPLFIIQEVVKFIVADCGWKYFFNVVTILQWVRHLVVVVNIIPAFMDPTKIPEWQFHVGVFLFILAWVLLLNDLAYIPKFALKLSILKVTLKNYATFLLFIGFPILVAFVPALCRYVTKDNQFLYVPFGIIKNFILMTGEVDYKETFYDEGNPDLTGYGIVGQFILVVVVFGFGLVLANVLTSVAVKDYQVLFKDAEYTAAVMQLKSISFVDSLVVWLSGFPITNNLSEFLTRWSQLDFNGDEPRTIEDLNTEGYSEELKALIKNIIATENTEGK